MPPFSKCSVCQVRTRKVVRDRVTWKNIYVCPTCFKGKEYQKKNKKRIQKEDVNASKEIWQGERVEQMTVQNVQNDSLEVQKDNVGPKEKDPESKPKEVQTEVEAQEENAPAGVVQVAAQEQVESVQDAQEMPLNDRSNVNNNRPKITPPMMEIVVINNRKYIAVSETADYDSNIEPLYFN